MAKKRRKSRKSSRKSRHGVLKRLERSLDKMGASTKYGGVSFKRARKQLGRGGRPRKGGLPPQLRGKGVVGTVLAATGLRPKKRSLRALIRLTGGYASPEQLSDAVEMGALTKDEAWLLDAHYQKARNARANRAVLSKRGGMSRPKVRSARPGFSSKVADEKFLATSKGKMHMEHKLPGSHVITRGSWVVGTDSYGTGSKPYLVQGKGVLTVAKLRAISDKVVAMANKTGRERFFEDFEVVQMPGGRVGVKLGFGS